MEKLLHKNGFILKRQSGSHRVYFNPTLDKTVVVPFHSKEIPQGTIRSIVKQSSLSNKIFLSR
ncbi:MAG: YcfA-like protein [Parcubacteria group bacterium GW2011_GWC1_38_6]|nr:MAG: YcfA-like protein [Parcubacteria group bacterium GW2011_GWC1_38_6]